MQARRNWRRNGVSLALAVGLLVAGLIYRQARHQALDRELISLIQEGKRDEALALLKAGANANSRKGAELALPWWRYLWDRWRQQLPMQKDGPTALMLACTTLPMDSHDTRLIEALIRHSADVNARDGNGDTALILAARNVQLDAARILVHYKADQDIGFGHGETLMSMAADHGHLTLLKELSFRRADLSVKDGNGNTLLHHAAMHGQAQVIQWLLDIHTVVGVKNNKGAEPLMLAAGYGSQPVVRLLLEHGAEVNARDKAGKTALMYACGAFDAEAACVELLRYGADVRARTAQGQSALTLAQARRGSPELARLLRQAGAKE